MGQLIDERHVGVTSEHRVEVHFLEDRPSIFGGTSEHHLEVGDQLFGEGPAVTLHESDDHISAPLLSPVALVEHGVGLPDSGGGTKIEAKVTSRLNLVVVV
jgi:hypothetical protein